jgi:cytochrome P450
MMLSRKEQVCAFRRIFERMDDIALQEDAAKPEYVPSMLFRGIEQLPITFSAR